MLYRILFLTKGKITNTFLWVLKYKSPSAVECKPPKKKNPNLRWNRDKSFSAPMKIAYWNIYLAFLQMAQIKITFYQMLGFDAK